MPGDAHSMGAASSYYSNVNTHMSPAAFGDQEQVGADGERGLGTMALGAAGGIAANKMNGGHHSNFKSGASGALLAQGAKMAYGMLKKHQQPGHSPFRKSDASSHYHKLDHSSPFPMPGRKPGRREFD